jgi:hypothetical protein
MNSSESMIVLVPKPDRRESLLQEMSAEWSRTPQLRLSPIEVQHRWQLESSTCSELLNVLVDLKVLTRSEDGTYRTTS